MMSVLEISILALSVFFILASAASLLKSEYWWIRIFDFPRFQIACLLVVLLAAFLWVFSLTAAWQWVMLSLMILSLVYQSAMIFPYTIFSPKQVLRESEVKEEDSISVIASNVLTPNRHVEKLIGLVKQSRPDILLTLESDKWWESKLQVLEEEYPETVKIPLDNLYGMHLYSKLKLHKAKVNYLFDKEIPSIEAYVELRSGRRIKIYCLHPMPPIPSQGEDTSTKRDAELLVVGKKIEKKKEPVLVFGDLNDVAWSHTTKLFQGISNLLDPRIGRGFFSTFHAKYPIFRWPLDHIFHSNDFTLLDIRVLPDIGSDHFPICFSLQYQPNAADQQEAPDADEEEEEESEEKIERAEIEART